MPSAGIGEPCVQDRMPRLDGRKGVAMWSQARLSAFQARAEPVLIQSSGVEDIATRWNGTCCPPICR